MSTAGIAIRDSGAGSSQTLADWLLSLHIPCVRLPMGQCSHPGQGLILGPDWCVEAADATQVVLHYRVPALRNPARIVVTRRDERRIVWRVVAASPRIAVGNRQPIGENAARFWLGMQQKCESRDDLRVPISCNSQLAYCSGPSSK